MTVLSTATGYRQPAQCADQPAPPPLTLAEEHVLLLCQVTARAREVLTVVTGGRWPTAELASLVGYIRAEVMRQVADEEGLLFPASAAPAAAGLARGHARLRAGAELLERAAAGEQSLSPGQLAVAIRDFADQLEYHMSAEEKVLGSGRAPHTVPAIATLGGHPHTWYPLTKGPVIDLDALPPEQAVPAAVDRLLHMRPGEQVELRSGTDISRVWRELDRISPGGYRFTALEDGPARWRMEVTRRQAQN